jgi:hypothetical protein
VQVSTGEIRQHAEIAEKRSLAVSLFYYRQTSNKSQALQRRTIQICATLPSFLPFVYPLPVLGCFAVLFLPPQSEPSVDVCYVNGLEKLKRHLPISSLAESNRSLVMVPCT